MIETKNGEAILKEQVKLDKLSQAEKSDVMDQIRSVDTLDFDECFRLVAKFHSKRFRAKRPTNRIILKRPRRGSY